MIELSTNRDQVQALLTSDDEWHLFQGIIRAKAEEPEIYNKLVAEATTFYSNLIAWIKIFQEIRLGRAMLDHDFNDATQEYFNFLQAKEGKHSGNIKIYRTVLVTFPNDFPDEFVKSIVFDLPEYFAGYQHEPVRIKLCYYLLTFQKFTNEEINNVMKLFDEDSVFDEFRAQYALFKYETQVLSELEKDFKVHRDDIKYAFAILNRETNTHHLYRRFRKAGYNPFETLDLIKDYLTTIETNYADIKRDIDMFRKYKFIKIKYLTPSVSSYTISELNLSWFIQTEPELFLNWNFSNLDNLGNYYIHLNYSVQQLYQILEPTWKQRIHNDDE